MHVWAAEQFTEGQQPETIIKEVTITRIAWDHVMWQGELEMSFWAQGWQVRHCSEWPEPIEIIISDKYAKIIP